MKRVGNFLDLSGDRFGRLTVVKVSYKKHMHDYAFTLYRLGISNKMRKISKENRIR